MTNKPTYLVTEPPGLSRDALDNAVGDPNDTIVIVFCPKTGYGGIYTHDTGKWELHGPFDSKDEFYRATFARIRGSVAIAALLQTHGSSC